jgi:AraC-like DNA-binding protein
MDFLRLPELGIGTIHFGHMCVRVDSISGYYLLVFCRGGAGVLQTSHGAVTLNASRGICLAPGEPLIGEFSANCEQLVFRIDERLLHRISGQTRVRLPVTIDAGRVELKPWLSTLSMLLGDEHYVRLVQKSVDAALAYQQVFVAMLLAGMHSSEATASDCPLVPGCVLRAKAYIRDMCTRPITLSDIADAAHVPVRTLLHNFKRFSELTPMQYLRGCRLDAARQKLMDPRSETTTIASAAMEVGLSHLGRFSMAYLNRFGEYPSRTLASRNSSTPRQTGRSRS